MKFTFATIVCAGAFALAFGTPARADTLYVAAPAPAAAGHPLRLGPDHKAQQAGDLVNVLFNFSVQSTSTDTVAQSKNYNVGIGNGQGNLAIGFLRFPTAIQSQNAIASTRTKNGSNTFAASMMTTVVGVLPSGALQIAGDQWLTVNNQKQLLHVTGVVRPEDIDSTDSVLSTRIANVDASFSGNFQEKNTGLIRKILDFLF